MPVNPPDFERIFLKLFTYVIMYRLFLYGGGGEGWLPLNLSNYIVYIMYMYFHLHRNSKKETFHRVKIA